MKKLLAALREFSSAPPALTQESAMRNTFTGNISLCMAVCMSFLFVFCGVASGAPPLNWRADSALSHADAAVVVRVNSRSDTTLRWLPLAVNLPEIFPVGVGSAKLRICTVVRTVHGKGVEENKEIVLVHPPSGRGHRGFAHIVYGNSLVLVRELTRDERDLLKQRISEVRSVDWDATDVEFWTLAEPDEQWMGSIQLSAIPVERAQEGIGYVVREDQETDVLRGRVVEQVVHHAGVERDEEAVLDYIQDLFVLRDAVIARTEWRGKAAPESEEDAELDVFQRQVLQMALRKKAESAN